MEAMTYRFFGHINGDAMEYMPKQERADAMAHDPVPAYRTWLKDNKHMDEDELAAVETKAETAIDDAVEFALASPGPSVDELLEDVYAKIVL